MFLHGSCTNVSDGERYVIIVLVVSLVLRGEAVASIRGGSDDPAGLAMAGQLFALLHF